MTSLADLVSKYHATKNPVTKWSYREIIAKRIYNNWID